MSIKSDVSQSNDWLERLHESGYRLTSPRRAVVETVATSAFLLNPMEIFIQARQRYPALGLVTVYRTLEKLEELSLVQRVHQADGCNSYVAAASGHQHLLICRRCNRAEYFSGDDLSDLFASIGAEHGYRVDGHWLQLFGLCENCVRDEKEGPGKNE
jgi:Fur family ferric uptake transcriptional regulator